MDGYRFLMQNYKSYDDDVHDKVCLFGLSSANFPALSLTI